MAKLTLDGNVSLQRLQQFADEAGDKSIRMKTEDGVKVLYTSDKKSSGVKNFFTGQSDNRRQAALTEIRTLLSNFQTSASSTGAEIDGSILAFVPDHGKIKGTDLGNVVKATIDDARTANEAEGNGALAVYAFQSGDPEAMKALVPKLTANLQAKIDDCTSIEEKNELRNAFAANTGKAGKNAILRAMAEVEGGHVQPGTTYDNASPELKAFLDKAYNLAVAGLDGHRCLDPKGDQIEFNGVKYTREKRGGEGGFGTVDIYKREGGEERIAVKRPIVKENMKPEVLKEAFDAYLQEFREHARVGTDGDPNVMGLKGIMRGAMGEPLIVVDAAPYGDVFEAQMKLFAANGSADAKTTVALTLLQDMARGLAKVHEEGVAHIDVKGPNFLIGKDGQAQVCDLGTAGGETEERTLQDGTKVGGAKRTLDGNPIDNPIWSAPELIYGGHLIAERSSAVKSLTEARVSKAKEELESQGFTGQELDTLLENVKKSAEQRYEQAIAKRQIELTEKADVWSFGMCAFQLLMGEELPAQFQSGFNYEIGNAIVQFGQDSTSRIFTAKPGEDLTPEQEFINWIMHPDPDQRPSMQEIVDHPIFNRLGVGGDEAYDVVKSLKSGDNLSDKLQALEVLTG